MLEWKQKQSRNVREKRPALTAFPSPEFSWWLQLRQIWDSWKTNGEAQILYSGVADLVGK